MVKLAVSELTIEKSFLLLKLGEVDIVLGMQWLNTLGVT